MRKNKFEVCSGLIFIAIFTLLFNLQSKAQSGIASIYGSSTNPTQLITLYRNIGPMGLISQKDTIRPNEKGKFTYKLSIDQPQNLFIRFGEHRRRLFVEPNSSINLILNDSTASITGEMSGYANYYIEKEIELQKLYAEYSKRHPELKSQKVKLTDEYFIIQDSITEKQIEFLKNYFSAKKIPGKQQFIHNEILSIVYSRLFHEIPSNVKNIRQFKDFQIKIKNISPSINKFSSLLTMNNRQLLSIPEYREFVTSVIPLISRTKIADEGKPFSFDLWIDNQMAAIDSLTTDPYCNIRNKAIILNLWVFQIKLSRRSIWLDKIYSEIADLEKNDKDHVLYGLKDELDAFVKDTRFLKGADAPAFTFIDSSGKIYHLTDFKGKKIYIDIWATWCGPCIALGDAWDRIVNDYTVNDSIVFLSVSLDNKRDDWLNYVKKQHINGLVLHAGDGGWNSSFAINYDIHGIPHFILLDENGKIISYIAPLPDNPDELKRLIKHPEILN